MLGRAQIKKEVNISNGEIIERGRIQERKREIDEGEVKRCARIGVKSVRVKN